MLQAGADNHEVVLAQHLHGVADDAARPLAVLHEVELDFLVAVERIVKLFFVSIDKIEAVLF